MFAYLLLRDNKQSGPYSVEDLKVIGIRPTDLLWIEGRSAAWQYPDQIEELRAFVHALPKHAGNQLASHSKLPIEHKENTDNPLKSESRIQKFSYNAPESKFNPAKENDVEKQPQYRRNPEIRKNLNQENEISGNSFIHNPEREDKPSGSTGSPINRVIDVIIADDHRLFREGVKTAMSQKEDVQIIGEAENGMQLMHLLKHSRPDVILLDIQMPIMDGISALGSIRKQYPEMKVIILSMHEGHSMVSTLMEAGANGYLTKTTDPETIYQAIKTCYEKNYYFSELTNVSMLEGLRSRKRVAEKKSNNEFDGQNLMLKLTAAQKKSNRYASHRVQKRVLIGATSVLLMMGVALGINMMARSSNSKKGPEAIQKNINNNPPSASNLSSLQTIPPSSNRITDSAHRKNGETEFAAEKNNMLQNVKKNNADRRNMLKLRDSLKMPSAVLVQQTDSSQVNHLVPEVSARSETDEMKTQMKSGIRSLVTASLNSYHKGTFGGLSEIFLTVNNRSAYTMDEVMVEVQYFLSNSKLYKTETLNFINIKPSSSQILEAPKSTRGVKIEYKIISIRSRDLDL